MEPQTAPLLGNVAVDNHSNPTVVQFHLKTSQCALYGKGADIILGRTGGEICPVSPVLPYLEKRRDAPGPFFLLKKNQPVSKQWFVQKLRMIPDALSLPQSSYAGHSFRIGAATAAALAGLEDSTIQKLGR